MAAAHRLRALIVPMAMSVLLHASVASADDPAPTPSTPSSAESPPPEKEPADAAPKGGDDTPRKPSNKRGRTTASQLPPSAAKRAILDVQKQARDSGIEPDLIDRPLGEAVRAAERARGARDAGDGAHGGLLDKLAQQWATAGRAVLRAIRSERVAKKSAEVLAELTTKVKRAEALLHEQQARLGRLRAELKRLEAKRTTDKRSEIESEKKRVTPKKKETP